MKRRRKGKKVKSVYTVEAAIIIPMVLFTMATGIRIGIDLYKKAEQYASDIREVRDYEEVETVHKIRMAGKIGEAVLNGN